jgi:peptide/nickel transport system permease protein
VALIIGLTSWPPMSRLVRAQVRDALAQDYVAAARAVGMPPLRLAARHVVPAAVPQMLVAATLAVASVIPLEAGLSFLGIGVPVPAPSWGGILLEGYEQGMRSWWMLLFPGLALVGTVLSINVIGEQLRTRIEPRSRNTGG